MEGSMQLWKSVQVQLNFLVYVATPAVLTLAPQIVGENLVIYKCQGLLPKLTILN